MIIKLSQLTMALNSIWMSYKWSVRQVHISILCSPISAYDADKVVILDDKIDALLPSIREFMLENGLDPTQVADFSESILPKLVSNYSTNNRLCFLLIIIFSNLDRNQTFIYKSKYISEKEIHQQYTYIKIIF